MNLWLVERPHNDFVIVTIMKNKSDNTYSFINLSKEHICTCRFDSINAALADMDERIKEGSVVGYKLLGEIP